MIQKIVFATHNKHKLAEVKAMMDHIGVEVIGADEAGMPDVEETGKTFVENALLKVRSGALHTGLPVLAEDSGLCINALGGSPGLYSARFAAEHGGYPSVFKEVNRLLEGHQDRSAYFTCTMVLAMGDGEHRVFEGRVNGVIDREATGTYLFGYGPIFIPEGYDVSAGVLGMEKWNEISHRANALQQVKEFLKGKSEISRSARSDGVCITDIIDAVKEVQRKNCCRTVDLNEEVQKILKK